MFRHAAVKVYLSNLQRTYYNIICVSFLLYSPAHACSWPPTAHSASPAADSAAAALGIAVP